MAGHRARRVTGAVLTAVLATVLAGCSDDAGTSSTTSRAASALESAGARATAAISSIAAQASEAIASATAEAGRRLDEVKDGIDVKDDVRIEDPATDADGRTTVGFTVRNTTDSAKSFAVQVVFRNSGGGLLDTVVVTVSDVASGESGSGTARSTHKLSGEVRAEVGKALRY